MSTLAFWVTPLFVATILAAIVLFYLAVRRAAPAATPWVMAGLALWLGLQGWLAARGFYLEQAASFPPRLVFGLAPPLLALAALFATPRGRSFVDRLPAEPLTYFHTVRLPVELVLYGLFTAGLVPELMTFAGRNFDILSGLTAPLIAYFGFTRPRLGRGWILAWHLLSLGLVINIVTHGVLAAPTVFQQFAFDQPNVGVLQYPFVWLPTFLVPMVLLSLLTVIRRLTSARQVAMTPQLEIGH
jgi:hypothetical protein